MNRPPDVLVAGVGRSGTSTVARILHDHLGVCMGDQLPPPDSSHPEGNYELGLMTEATRRLVRDSDFAYFWKRWNRAHGCGNTLVGFKNAYLAELAPRAWAIIAPTLIVLATRDRQSILPSLLRWSNHDAAYWNARIDVREEGLQRLRAKPPCQIVEIDFNERRTDDEVADALGAQMLGRKRSA